jgi:prefoldin subunit 5
MDEIPTELAKVNEEIKILRKERDRLLEQIEFLKQKIEELSK